MRTENYWLSLSQRSFFREDIELLKKSGVLHSKSKLPSLYQFLDSDGIMRVTGREQKLKLAYSAMHPIILCGKHILVRLIIQSEHLRLLHAGCTLLRFSLGCKYHIIGARKAIRCIIYKCVTCLCFSEKPKPQLMGQLPLEQVTPDIVFENRLCGSHLCQVRICKEAHNCESIYLPFVSSVKAVHLELVSGTPNFGGLWESAVKSMKYHLKHITANIRLIFEEYSTVLTQVDVCLNSRPLIYIPCDSDGVEMLTPAHFPIGRPLEAIPDPSFSYRPISLLWRWHLCQNLVRQFWQRWKQEYLASLRKHSK